MKLFNDLKVIANQGTISQKITTTAIVTGDVLLFGSLAALACGVAAKAAAIAAVTGGVLVIGGTAKATYECHKAGISTPFDTMIDASIKYVKDARVKYAPQTIEAIR